MYRLQTIFYAERIVIPAERRFGVFDTTFLIQLLIQPFYRKELAPAMPDVPLNRQCIRELQIRIAERIGRNDVDGAWYDIMSVLHFSRHYIAKTNGVEKLIGIAVERIAAQSIKLLLQKGNPSKEQLAKFAADLDSLPNRWQSEYFNIEFERMSVYSCLFYSVGANEADDSGSEKEYIVWKAKTL